MKKALILALAVVSIAAITGCSRNPCRKLAAQVCEKAGGTAACEAAGRLTAADECADFLAHMDKFIEIKNSSVTTDGVKPPAPPAPPVEPATAPDAAVQPDTAPASAQPAPAAGATP